MPIQTDNKLWSEVLLKLFGNARPEPYRQTSPAHRIGLPNAQPEPYHQTSAAHRIGLPNAWPEPYRQTSGAHSIGLPNLGVRFTSKGEEEGLCEISEIIQHA